MFVDFELEHRQACRLAVVAGPWVDQVIREHQVAVGVGGSHLYKMGRGNGIACFVEGGSGRAGAAAVTKGDLRAHLSRILGEYERLCVAQAMVQPILDFF